MPARSGARVLRHRGTTTRGASLGATSLATVMQMVANGYGVTLLPEVAADVEVRDSRVKLLRFVGAATGRTVGLAWRRTSPRKRDFAALGEIVTQALASPANRGLAAENLGGERARSRPPLPQRLVVERDTAARAAANERSICVDR